MENSSQIELAHKGKEFSLRFLKLLVKDGHEFSYFFGKAGNGFFKLAQRDVTRPFDSIAYRLYPFLAQELPDIIEVFILFVFAEAVTYFVKFSLNFIETSFL